ELLQVAGTEGDWILEVEVPDDDMGPILAAQSQLEKDIKAGRKKPDATLSAYFVTMTDPEHRYNGYVRRIAPSGEDEGESEESKDPPRGEGDGRLLRGGQAGLHEAQRDHRDATRGRGPCAGPVWQDEPGLLPAPQARPGLPRVGPVPLAVLEK